MTDAFNLRADDASAGPIMALWDEAGRLEPAPSMRAHGYLPHVTLAIWEEPPRPDMADVLAAAGAGIGAIVLTFVRIRWFEGVPMVLWLEPEPCPALDRLHAAVHRHFEPRDCHPRYRPGRFVPHATLALHIGTEGVAGAEAMAARPFAPFSVRFDRLDWLRFPPSEVLATAWLEARP